MRQKLKYLFKKNFQFKLSVAIPAFVTMLVTITGLLMIIFCQSLIEATTIPPQEYIQVKKALQFMTVSYFISLAFAFMVAMAVTYFITKPIQRLVDKARAIASGDLAYNLDMVTYDEFSVLEKTFNEMAKALKEYRDEIENYNKTLERKVEERTRELRTVLSITKNMIFMLDKERLVKLVMARLKEVTRYDFCSFTLFDEEQVQIFIKGSVPYGHPLYDIFRERVFRETERMTSRGIDRDRAIEDIEETGELMGVAVGDAINSFLIVPLPIGSLITGSLAIGAAEADKFKEDQFNILTIIANHAGLAIENTKTYAKMKELDQLKSEFISTVSHELRTPLTSIREGIDLLTEPSFGTLAEKQMDLIAIIKRNSERLYVIIDDLLDLSKLESGEITFHKEKVGLITLVEETVGRMRLQAEKKGIALTVKQGQETPSVYVDSDKVSQVLTNLVGNAVKFTPEGGVIQITVRTTEGNAVECRIFNNGTPIREEELTKIFDKFYQVGRKPGPGARGTGLGLPIAKEIIRKHEGRIWAASSEKGNTFIFELPVFHDELFLDDKLELMIAKAKERKSFFSFILIRVINLDYLAERTARTAPCLLEAVEQKLKEEFEKTGVVDVIGKLEHEQSVVLLAMTDKEGSERIIADVLQEIVDLALEKFSFSEAVQFKSGIALYPVDGMDKAHLYKVVKR
ncbi:MAG: HAMP domain-containing protein [Candidatus Omnitrophica bacterium]|nr:HAMP domain-containing protein [Candidatus Omnitrophota bacterium]